MTLKVVHICQRDDPGTGGAVRVAVEYVKRLPAFGIDAHCLFLYGEEGHFKTILGDHAHYLGLRSSLDILKYIRLRSFLHDSSPQIIHHHDGLLWSNILTYYHRGMNKFTHAHSSAGVKSGFSRGSISEIMQRRSSDMLVCITEDTRQSQINYGQYMAGKTCVIHNGVDLSRFRAPTVAESGKARESFGLNAHDLVVGFVGRLDCEMKGADDFIKMFSRLPPNFRALIAGAGPDADYLRKLAEDLQVASRIVYAGLLEDTQRAYHAMNVFCLTSHYEPFGLVVAEAMASNVPVVGFACAGGVSELLTSETGHVVLTRNPEEMAQAVLHLIERPDETARLKESVSLMLGSKYDWQFSVRELAELYRSQLGGDSPEGERRG